MIKIFIFSVAIVVVMWFAGIRMDLGFVQKKTTKHLTESAKVTLQTGQSITGQLLERNKSGVTLDLGGGTITLKSAEIKQIETLSKAAIEKEENKEVSEKDSTKTFFKYQEKENKFKEFWTNQIAPIGKLFQADPGMGNHLQIAAWKASHQTSHKLIDS